MKTFSEGLMAFKSIEQVQSLTLDQVDEINNIMISRFVEVFEMSDLMKDIVDNINKTRIKELFYSNEDGYFEVLIDGVDVPLNTYEMEFDMDENLVDTENVYGIVYYNEFKVIDYLESLIGANYLLGTYINEMLFVINKHLKNGREEQG